MSERHRLDLGRLEEWLRLQVPGYAGPLEVAQFEGGQSNPTYLLSAASGRYVLRSKPAPASQLLPSAHAIEREVEVMKALEPAGIPVPPVLGLCGDESVLGRAFYVMAHVEGRLFWDPSLPGLSPGERAAIYDETNRVIAALHRVDVDAVGLRGFGRPGNYFQRQIARWTRQYRASETEALTAMDRLIDWLPAHVPPGEETAIVHGDFRLDNLIFDPACARVVAVIDWELATLGHPLADLAYHCLAWHIPPGGFRGMAGIDLAALGLPTEDNFVQRYCERTGRHAPGDWDFYLAYNLFRLAAILQGVYHRALQGTAASDAALRAGADARALAQLGWARACGDRVP